MFDAELKNEAGILAVEIRVAKRHYSTLYDTGIFFAFLAELGTNLVRNAKKYMTLFNTIRHY